MNIYACSDIHGQYELYQDMIKDIQLSDKDTLYILGDVIDRGPASIETMLDIMDRPNVILLLGNHELMMYDYLNWNRNGLYWTHDANGGYKTKEAYDCLPLEEQERVLAYIRDSYLQVDIEVSGKRFLLSHSSFLFGMQDPDENRTRKWSDMFSQTVFDTVWNSPWRNWEYMPLCEYKNDNRIHVIGHVPTLYIPEEAWPDENKPEMPAPYIDMEYNVINIDTGCAALSRNDKYAEMAGLCCMNITEYAKNGKENAFRIYRPHKAPAK